MSFDQTGVCTPPFGDYASQEGIDSDLSRASAFQHPRRATRTPSHIFPVCYHTSQQDTLESALSRASATPFPRNVSNFAPHGRGDLSTLPPLPPIYPPAAENLVDADSFAQLDVDPTHEHATDPITSCCFGGTLHLVFAIVRTDVYRGHRFVFRFPARSGV